MAKREQPEVIEIEKRLLSAMLLKEGKVIPDVIDILKAEDFYRPEHRVIYQAAIDIYSRGTPPNPLLIEEELRRTDKLKCISLQYLLMLVEAEYSTARATAYAETIREKSIRRQLNDAGDEIADDASDETKSIEEVLDSAGKKILSVTLYNKQKGFAELVPILQSSLERIFHIRNHKNELSGIPTGIHDLDKLTNGFQKSDMIILAARPSMGKTALALNMALGAAKRGKVVAIFSLEMSKAQLGNRLLSLESGISSQDLNTGHLTRDDLSDLVDASERLEDLKLYIDDTAGLRILEMRSKLRRLKHEHGLDLVVLDYLQLMQGGQQENRQQEISEISRSLKAMARELEVPILALSQLSRNVELRAEKKPQLSDLRESGSLEQDADIVMFLYRDEYYNRDDAESQNIAELIIAKNRNGPTVNVNLQFNKEIMRFGDLTRREQ